MTKHYLFGGYPNPDPDFDDAARAEADAEESRALELAGQEDEADRIECEACCGEGLIPVGEYGNYYRDGEKYDPPGWEVCETCGGEGRVL